MYPQNDRNFIDYKITSVNGSAIKLDNGMCIHVPDDSPVKPDTGMTMRLYGKGLGFQARGMFLDGQKVYYRSEEDHAAHQDIVMYGENAQDWLNRWDADQDVWSIEMGGLGPGYEQAIQIAAAELLRFMLAKNYDADFWEDKEIAKKHGDEIRAASYENEAIKKLGLSGAQFGAAMNLASCLYRNGPIAVMKDKQVKDRHIQVRKNFPKGNE